MIKLFKEREEEKKKLEYQFKQSGNFVSDWITTVTSGIILKMRTEFQSSVFIATIVYPFRIHSVPDRTIGL